MLNSTTNEETPRTCCSCNEPEFAWDNVGLNAQGLCPDCASEGDYPTGYEADDERPYGWDVPEDEYPDW
jgi:hypothetical protein